MIRSQRAKAATAGIAVGALVLAGTAEPAAAAPRVVKTLLDGGWPATGRGDKVKRGDIRDWSEFRVGELRPVGSSPASLICGYQASLWWESPNGSVIQTQNSSYHSGCSWVAWMDYPNFEGGYQVGTKFPAKWRSNHTTNRDWILIGKLT